MHYVILYNISLLFSNRFYVSTWTHNCLRTSHVNLSKGLRSREEEDKVSSYFLLKAIADTCRVSATIEQDIQEPEIPEESVEPFDEDQELQQVINGQICMKVYHFAAPLEKNFSRKVILPGSFNPLHDGHLRLLEVASSMCDDGIPFFEISAINADKPPLSISEIKRRVEQFRKAGVDAFHFAILLACCLDCHSNLVNVVQFAYKELEFCLSFTNASIQSNNLINA